MVTVCVACEVRNFRFSVFYMKFGFDPRSVHVRSVSGKVALGGGQVRLFPRHRHSAKCSLRVFVYMLLLTEEQTGEAWELKKKKKKAFLLWMLSGIIGQKITFLRASGGARGVDDFEVLIKRQ